ncbi:hypothetical protein [Methylobacterium oxalidis]|uniref:Lipoprotein n=1 Tax=Methylobacterium oxalidis TaxID=944322 RepID=A0A512J510_9HYPH|nr:hypothetical protein [Methylobacterium oxalidis]GEP05046.1 hypothetical protein MOX02_30840 [Methylobacterium oxalidis]GJE33356.1 hypothetical protein LDDCCGHA_3556 [Methylobacterium oxalidis]GLS65675.1 hypothetical protein GCM10007888_40570 [Methylobacterium oxalidis]
MASARHALSAVALLVSALTAACSADTSPLRLAEPAKRNPETPDFVAASRRGGDYLPVGISAPQRPVRAKSAESQKALAAELEGARSRNEARGRAAEGEGKGAGKGAGEGAGKSSGKSTGQGAAPGAGAE